jgi:DNA-binding IclR family transcriptional regulator
MPRPKRSSERFAAITAWLRQFPNTPARDLSQRFGVPERSARAVAANFRRRHPLYRGPRPAPYIAARAWAAAHPDTTAAELSARFGLRPATARGLLADIRRRLGLTRP